MTSSELQAAGETLFGRQWQTKLATVLKVEPRTVRRWASGRIAVPGPVEVAIKCMLREYKKPAR